MEFCKITSKDNSLIKFISRLQSQSSARKESGLFVLEGLRICSDAYENGIRFDKLIVSDSAFQKYEKEILQFSFNSDECVRIPDSIFKKISDTTSPQGIIAVSKIPENNKLKIEKTGRYIALENISDPSNLGAVARTAEALGVSGIILSSGGCDPYSPKSLRASMGTLLRVPLFIFENFAEEISACPLKTYACVVDKTAQSICEFELGDGSVMIIGNEANGITEETKKSADYLLTIPMRGRAESLNAAVAASISMWEMMK